MAAHDQDSAELRDAYLAELADTALDAIRRIASALGIPEDAVLDGLAEELAR